MWIKNWIELNWVRSGRTLTKSRIVPCQILSWLLTLSALPVSLIGANSDWIHQLNSKNNGSVCYLRLYFGNDNISRRLLQWIARIKNGLKLKPTTRYRTYSNQISTRLIPISRRGRLWSSLWQDMQGHVGKISTRSWLVRLDLWDRCHIDGYTTCIFSYL